MNDLCIEDLTVSFDRVPAIHHLNLSLARGTCAGLLGPNGAGKTTLLRAIAGLVKIESGRIAVKSRENGVNGGHRNTIAYLPQREGVDWDFPITVRGLVEMGRYPALGTWRRFGAKDLAIVEEALQAMDLADFAGRQIKALSGGQQQRTFLARAWAQQADIYLLDEPFRGLDRNAQRALTKALHALCRAGKLIIASHHDLTSVPEVFGCVIFINGELVACGETASTFTADNIARTFDMPVFAGHHAHSHT